MHGQFAEDPEVIPFARARNGAAPGADDQLDKAGQTILQLVAQAAGIADDNSRHALGMASFRINCERLKTALPSWRLSSLLLEKEPIVPSNGSVVSMAKLKTAFFNKAIPAAR